MAGKVAIVSTYPPRRCGLATFAAHLRAGLLAAGAGAVPVAAMVKDPAHTPTAPEVVCWIRHDDPASYREAARRLDAAGVDAVLLQHEFGIFGGSAGRRVNQLLDALRTPVIATLHTVLAEPEAEYREALLDLVGRVRQVVVMARRAVDILEQVYGVPRNRVAHIPHGVPAPPPDGRAAWRSRLGLEGQTVAMTFGLIGPGKGIETALEAVAAAVRQAPDLLYLVVGATHPEVLRTEGERYRRSLEALVADLGLCGHVRFVDRYLEEEELLGFLQAADMYITPYPGAQQITSGTLTYALAMGLPVVSTPYAYARELLADGTGILVPFRDADAMGRAIAELARNPARRAELAARARERTRGYSWPEVAARYLDLAARVAAATEAEEAETEVMLR